MMTIKHLAAAGMVLAVAVVAGCSNDNAKAEMAQDHVRKLNKAAKFFFVEKKTCPTNANELAKLFTGQDNNEFDFSKDPWGNDFVMYQDAEGEACQFKSLGSDGKEGGAGYAADIVSEPGATG